ncbi:glycosyltransferase [Glutamicibacter protophormiae]|uniref:glycosyltransferase n=1 Tax=Glutamicibacter protophormiae TaxID=37930 RepID=UPI002A83A7AC|nr:glycosyltransferase [Glutamicibacter protophormiae]WPR66129.1 glycosyltransferase [Glutamicibacter protophormiae]WPR69626.1 glycosyltransferase [Glutamicibacter protophormiae]
MDYVLSIVVPMYNADNKLGVCVDSLVRLSADEAFQEVLGQRAFEVLFVDDKSTDNTYATLAEFCDGRNNWSLYQTATNSGSPSKPRNIGIENAQGEYIFFLDGDDEIDPVGITAGIASALRNGHDLVRGSVVVNYWGERRAVVDRLKATDDLSVRDMIVAIANGQSLNCSALWKWELLDRHQFRFDPETRMGEDLVFTAAAMISAASIGYVDYPMFHYTRQIGGGDSAMHYYSGRELRELVTSWQRVEDSFAERSLSYLELHGDRTINYALRLVIRNLDTKRVNDQDLKYFASFFTKHKDTLRDITFTDPHVHDLVQVLSEGELRAIKEELKPRLLIAGHDLKFIKPSIPLLRKRFQVQIDEWQTEIVFTEKHSEKWLAWADYIWVEWLTAASVWYSERVRPTQKFVVRVHRYELGRSYGDQIKRDAVSAFITIAPHCMEDLIERFEFDRGRVRYIPNFYFIDSYKKANPRNEDRLFKLAIIGAVPQRKGYLKALQLLAKLRETDDRYSLTVMGKSYKELSWVAGDPLEQAYFASCDSFIEKNDLTHSVQNLGWVNTYESVHEYAFVLSTSEHEGSHVGPGEAFCAGNQGVFLPWRGVEYVYPETSVFDDIDAMAAYILSMRNLEDFNKAAISGQEYMLNNYDIDLFIDRVDKLFRSV